MASLQTPILAALILLAIMLQATEAEPALSTGFLASLLHHNVPTAPMWKTVSAAGTTFATPLPSRVVKHFFWTSDSCRRPGVVLLTTRNMKICADPRLSWVKKTLQKLRK